VVPLVGSPADVMLLHLRPTLDELGTVQGRLRCLQLFDALEPDLIIVGGQLYTIGALVYGTKRPNPSPRWFGFHEVFHAFTLAGFASHHVGIWLAAFGVGAVAVA
jgi:predicted membrane channel-forming protein YqfA (hemolysin III family)